MRSPALSHKQAMLLNIALAFVAPLLIFFFTFSKKETIAKNHLRLIEAEYKHAPLEIGHVRMYDHGLKLEDFKIGDDYYFLVPGNENIPREAYSLYLTKAQGSRTMLIYQDDSLIHEFELPERAARIWREKVVLSVAGFVFFACAALFYYWLYTKEVADQRHKKNNLDDENKFQPFNR